MIGHRISVINICRIEKRGFLLLSVIYAGRSMLCEGAQMHKRGIVHRMEIRHRA
jgi:hypothetical protein